jgi:hypothetical protein
MASALVLALVEFVAIQEAASKTTKTQQSLGLNLENRLILSSRS